MHRYKNQEGVEIRPHDYGGLRGVAALDPSSASLTATYQPLISALEAVGYRERETLWAAPYDWRLAGDGLAEAGAADDLQSLIEMAVSAAAGHKAVIIAHSMVRCLAWHMHVGAGIVIGQDGFGTLAACRRSVHACTNG